MQLQSLTKNRLAAANVTASLGANFAATQLESFLSEILSITTANGTQLNIRETVTHSFLS
jgi:hypothetical protein